MSMDPEFRGNILDPQKKTKHRKKTERLSEGIQNPGLVQEGVGNEVQGKPLENYDLPTAADKSLENIESKKTTKGKKPAVKKNILEETGAKNGHSSQQKIGVEQHLSLQETSEPTDETQKTKKKKRKRLKPVESKMGNSQEYQDSVFMAQVQELQEDIIQVTEFAPPPLDGPVGISAPSSKLFVEQESGFKRISEADITKKKEDDSTDGFVQKNFKNSLTVALEVQSITRIFYSVCHGILGGAAFWQLILVHQISSFEHYSVLAQPLQALFYVLLVICLISSLDRYDIGRPTFHLFYRLVTLQSAALLVLIYAVTLIIHLCATELDERLGFHRIPGITIDNKEILKVTQADLKYWKNLNLCRCIGAILGWIIYAFKTDTDLLYKHLKELPNTKSPISSQPASASPSASSNPVFTITQSNI